MSDIAILREMIRDTAIVPLEGYHHQKKVRLEEKEEKATSRKSNYSFDILGLPDEEKVIVIKIDNFKSPDSIFNPKQGACKRCDYAIVTDLGQEKLIIFIELKGGDRAENKDIMLQFKGGQCFIRYCQDIGRSFWNKQDFLAGYKCRFVAVTKIASLAKTRTGYRGMEEINDTPEKMFKISRHKDVQFKMLYQILPKKQK